MMQAEGANSFSPFRYRAFTLLWTATLISNIGTWMHDVGAGWLMTSLSPSPAIVSLVQTATTAPIFLLALFAGALADQLDKRRFLLIVNAALFLIILLLAILISFDLVTPGVLLAFTFAIGAGAALMAPAWQAIVPNLVPRSSLQSAIALNSMGINIARAIGPAIAGVLISAFAIAAPFYLNAVSHLVIMLALLVWKPEESKVRNLQPEPVFGAMVTGLRHASRNGPLKATLIRSFGFFSFASAYWALLPIVVRNMEHGSAEQYGILLASIGFGAVLGALALPSIRVHVEPNRLVVIGTALTAIAMVLLAFADDLFLGLPAAVLGGLGWIMVLTSLNVSAQTALPNWVRARGLAIVLMVFFGCMAAGSAIWGQVASALSIWHALIFAAIGICFVMPLTWGAKLGQGESQDLSPAMSWPEPSVSPSLQSPLDRGPVMVTIRYTVDEQDTAAFLAASLELSNERYRDGAYDWGVFQDVAEPEYWLEWFFLPSWAEHIRQHERTTRHDEVAHALVRSFHRGALPPEVRHLLAPTHSV